MKLFRLIDCSSAVLSEHHELDEAGRAYGEESLRRGGFAHGLRVEFFDGIARQWFDATHEAAHAAHWLVDDRA